VQLPALTGGGEVPAIEAPAALEAGKVAEVVEQVEQTARDTVSGVTDAVGQGILGGQ